MSKLAAAIRSHFVVFPYVEAKAPCSSSARQMVAPIIQGLGFPPWRTPGVVVSKPLTVLPNPPASRRDRSDEFLGA
jgi:hypothetical protein